MPLGPRCGSKPAGSAEKAAFSTPPWVGLVWARLGCRPASSRLVLANPAALNAIDCPRKRRRVMTCLTASKLDQSFLPSLPDFLLMAFLPKDHHSYHNPRT